MSRALLCGQIIQFQCPGVIHSALKQVKFKDNVFERYGTFLCRPWHRFKSDKSIKSINQSNTSFADFLNFRKEEAKRSIVVQVQSARSYKELYLYCNHIGNVNQMFHYTSGVEPLHFILVEFSSPEDVQNVLSVSCHLDETQVVPVKSPFLWFKLGNKPKSTLKLTKLIKLSQENGTKIPAKDTIITALKNAEDVSDQMHILYKLTKLNDLGFRLRFLTARQIELALTGMFPDAVAYPFGSSVNGYGKMGCDLDLILRLNGNKQNLLASRLVYQCKEGLGNERSQSQRHMEAIGDILHLFLPGCSQVRRILQARVPILKYNQQFTDVECDLSMSNMMALRMSELLYFFGSIDARVRPLVFAIRKWAEEVSVTNPFPGRWITNFSLTLLVLAFLQHSKLILPSINTLWKAKGIRDFDMENSSSITFLGNVKASDYESNNTDTPESLLIQFFEYFSSFDFMSKAISLNEATAIPKPEHSALYIVNPLERGLNVSKNVSLEEVERFRLEMRNASWYLESQIKRNEHWGLLQLCLSRNKVTHSIISSQSTRLMEVKKLFETNDQETKPLTSLEEKYTNKSFIKENENLKLEIKNDEQQISNKIRNRSLKKNTVGVRRR